MSLITIANDHLKVSISTLGAELQSITDSDGNERLWNGDPAFWTGRAYVLFPVAGGFKDDCYELNGMRYNMPKHGFARRAEWLVETAEADKAVFLLTEKHPGFPFDYELRAIYTLKGNALEVSYSVTGCDERDFWFSVGCHEGYMTPEGIEEYEVVFDEEECLAAYPLDGNLCLHEPVVIAENTRTLPLKYDFFKTDALVFRGLKSKGVTLQGGRDGRKLRVDFPDHPILMLWTKPNEAPYICIECWCNGPDFVDAPANIAEKPGFMRVEKGQTVTRTHTITFIK